MIVKQTKEKKILKNVHCGVLSGKTLEDSLENEHGM